MSGLTASDVRQLASMLDALPPPVYTREAVSRINRALDAMEELQMSDIKPALTAEQWAEFRRRGPASLEAYLEQNLAKAIPPISVYTPEQVIAAANAALPDDDPRKITWEHVRALRVGLDVILDEGAPGRGDEPPYHETIAALADILASYLPPEQGT